MQMVSVAASAGVATSCAPSRMATVSFFPEVRLRWMFSTATVASSTSMPMASASPPRVMRLRVLSVRKRPAMPTRIARGMELETMATLRKLPRKKRIISETRMELMTASWSTLVSAARTKIDWSKSSLRAMPSGAAAWIDGSRSFTPSTTARVPALECLRMTM